MKKHNFRSVDMKNVNIKKGFWANRQELNAKKTEYAVYDRSKETGRIEAFKLDWSPGKKPKPHKFWDSDVAKWLESAAYSLYHHPDKQLKERVDEVIDLIVQAQQPDGYLNIVFTVVRPEDRWKNLRDDHELYCAGHLIESAVAVSKYLDDDRLLEAMEKYTDYIDQTFGKGEGQIPGYPGHEEIELALVRLYEHTQKEKYLKLAEYFVDERGQYPYYFDIEAKKRGEPVKGMMDMMERGFAKPGEPPYYQAHLPAVEQDEAMGHSVRACYFYSGMADIAIERNDQDLLDACKALWEDIALKKMYITGGIGTTHLNEGWTFPYDLPNETAYAETCAAIAWLFFNHRLSKTEINGKYGDMMEKALYNGILSGISLDGEKFFYVNPLEVAPYDVKGHKDKAKHTYHERQKFFTCSCCPPNIARLIASIGDYFYNEDESGNIVVNFYGENDAEFSNGLKISQRTSYPWDGRIKFLINEGTNGGQKSNSLWLRIPKWTHSFNLTLNGEKLEPEVRKGYVELKKEWKKGDEIELDLQMTPQFVYANPRVSADIGKVSIQRGPIIYCFEEEDNEIEDFRQIWIKTDEKIGVQDAQIAGEKIKMLICNGEKLKGKWGNTLYKIGDVKTEEISLKGIPYYTWANRGKGTMSVWLNGLKNY